VDLLLRYNWPGNVRELDNVISRSVLKASAYQPGGREAIVIPACLSGDLVAARPESQNVHDKTPAQGQGTLSYRAEVKAFEIRLIQDVLERNQGNWAAAARELDMNRSNLHNLATRLGIRSKKSGIRQ
jgi:anaerobic nitric oxide reductase transcription regulator